MPLKVIDLSLSLGAPVAHARKPPPPCRPPPPAKKEITFRWFHPECVVVMMILYLI